MSHGKFHLTGPMFQAEVGMRRVISPRLAGLVNFVGGKEAVVAPAALGPLPPGPSVLPPRMVSVVRAARVIRALESLHDETAVSSARTWLFSAMAHAHLHDSVTKFYGYPLRAGPLSVSAMGPAQIN